MNRRQFIQRAAGGVAIAAFGDRTAEAQETSPRPAVSPAGTEARLRGNFFDLTHVNLWDAAYWTDTCRLWKQESWRALIRDMHGIGLDTAICYQYQGIMNRHTSLVDIGHPGTEKLYQDYQNYLRKHFP